jgi:hypothetical protein
VATGSLPASRLDYERVRRHSTPPRKNSADTAQKLEATDWDRIVVRYEALGRVAPSPVVELNRAVAVAMASGPEQPWPSWTS